MLSRSRLKYLQSLQLKKHRQKYNLFVGEGDKIALTALTHRADLIEEIICTEQWLDKHGHCIGSTPVTIGEARLIEQASSLRSKPQVLVLLRMEDQHLRWGKIPHAIYLDDVQDPGNVGTILRLADWYGVDAVIRSEGSADFYNPKTVQSSMGSLLNVQLHTMSHVDLHSLQGERPIYVTTMDGEDLHKVSRPDTSLLIMGHEGRGVSEDMVAMADHRITIPGHSQRIADSLNVAIATGIVAAHLYRVS